MPSGAIEIGKVTKTSKDGKTTTTKKANQSGILGIKYTDDEIRKSMNEKKNGGPVKKAKNGTTTTKTTISPFEDLQKKKDSLYTENAKLSAKKDAETAAYLEQQRSLKQRFNEAKSKFSKKTKLGSIKAKSGAMIKRADGSMSKRGLWDNIRKNKGSGKKPTKQMLVQEKKIKAKSKK